MAPVDQQVSTEVATPPRSRLRRLWHAVGGTLRQTATCVDFFASVEAPGGACLGGALKVSLPSLDDLRADRKLGRKRRFIYGAAGLSNNLLVAGYNPLFGGFNVSHYVPVRSGFGASMFVGGPYTGFIASAPVVSLGGWVLEGMTDQVDPFGLVTLALPGLSHVGVAVGVRLWIMSPALGPLVRPLQRPVAWVHGKRTRAQRFVGQKLKQTRAGQCLLRASVSTREFLGRVGRRVGALAPKLSTRTKPRPPSP